MSGWFGYVTARCDTLLRRGGRQRAQATVEYVGLIMILGAGLGMIVGGLDTLNFVSKIGGRLVKGIADAVGKVIP